MSWLNPADSKDIGDSYRWDKKPLLAQFEIEDKRCFEGAGLILFGKCFGIKKRPAKLFSCGITICSGFYLKMDVG